MAPATRGRAVLGLLPFSRPSESANRTRFPLALLQQVLSLVVVTVMGLAGMAVARGEEALPRRAFMGARFAPVPAAQQASLPEGQGVLITQVFPRSSALQAGLKADDIVTQLGGVRVDSAAAVVDLMGQHGVGDELEVELFRDGMRQELTLTLRPFPEESYEGIDVLYDHVKMEEGLLRSIVTRPAGAQGPAPSVYILQGYDCGSIDLPFSPDSDLARLVRHFSSLGFVTYRVEKAGVGDSQGAPCREAGFHMETEGFLRGLRRLKQYEFVDLDRVYLLGLSMGGIWAPLLAARDPVAGVMVYGTIGKPWVEYMEENSRRQALLQGRDYDAIEESLKEGRALWHYLLTEKMSPAEIVSQHPELRQLVAGEAGSANDLDHFYGRHYRFIQELNEINIARQWLHVEAPVLAMWGRGDYVSSRGDHQLVVDIVNRHHPDQASFVEVDADHWFNAATSFKESYARQRARQPGTFQDEVLAEIQAWLGENGGVPPDLAVGGRAR